MSDSVSIKVLFFGAASAATGVNALTISVYQNVSARNTFSEITTRFPALRSYKLIYAINQQYASGDEVVQDGDEIAIFTPVSGG